MDFRKEISLCLLEESEPGKFLQQAFELHQKAHPKTGFAQLARKMGFTSRSFVRQLALGTRRPNLQNYRQIAQGFGFSKEATEYFGLLIDLHRNSQPSPAQEKTLHEAEIKLRKSLQKNIKHIRKTDPVPFERWPFIYASLGSFQEGRSLKEIVQISGQAPKVCVEILNHLVEKELVRWDSKLDRYFPCEDVIDIGELGHSRVLKDLYKTISLEAMKRVETDLQNENSLFHSAVFSVPKEKMPQLTKDLQALLASYAATSEVSSGQELALLSASMIPLRRLR